MNFRSLRTKACACVCVLIGLAAVPPAFAVIEGVPITDSDRRFDAVGLFLTVQPGGQCGGWVSGSCTLIGRDTILVARHSVASSGVPLPTPGARTHRVRFRRGVSGASNGHYSGNTADCGTDYQECFIREFIASPGAGVDMLLGVLETSPVGIVPIAAFPAFAPVAGAPVTLAGWGFDGRCLQTGDAWTLRMKSGVLPPNPHASTCCFDYNNAVFSPCLVVSGDQWVVGNMHDSGAPLLVNVTVNGSTELRVAAIATSLTGTQRVSFWNAADGVPSLPLPAAACPADFNRTGAITVQDIFDYLTAMFGGLPGGDFNGSGEVTVQDVFDFLAAFMMGCP